MKKTKLFYGNQYIGKFSTTTNKYTKWQVFKYKVARLIRIIFMFTVGVGATVLMFYILQAFHGQQIVVKEVFVNAETIDELPPVMKRIAECESGNRQYADNGQVITNGNKNGSVDIGRFQINLSIWGETATELGYDLTKEEDNTNFALYLFENYGSEPWIWSKKCWN
jgi:hypothetical protein